VVGRVAAMILRVLAAGVIVYLFVSWALLAAIYQFPGAPADWLFFAENRKLSWLEAGSCLPAALMPGALFLILAIVAYGLVD